MGLSKLVQRVLVPFEITKLPLSSRAAEVAPAVADSQTVEPEPLTRRRLPEERNCKDPPESTAAPCPADQTTGSPPV